MKEKLLLIIVVAVQLFVLFQWTHCREFGDQFHFSSVDLQLRLIDGIHSDQNVPIFIVRFFHNKAIGTVFDLFNTYLQFWNPAFLASFMSLAGIVGVAAQFYSFFSAKKKQLFVWICFLAVVFVPFVEIIHLSTIPFMVRLVAVALPFVLWSTLGYWYLLKKIKINSKFIDVIILLSLWYQLALPTFSAFCFLKP